MTNPYSVLGVGRGATDEAIKAAYLDLVEKYSPVNYSGNPLADLADKKLQEINDAYDRIMAERRVGTRSDSGAWESYDGSPLGGSGGTQTESYHSAGSSSPELQRARSYINSSNYAAAEQILLNVQAAQRNAEWNYLMGRVMQSKGWLDQASKYYAEAARLDPQNPDYRSAAESMNARRNESYQSRSQNTNYNTGGNVAGCSPCNICSSLICADCCCECMGSDLIRCC